MVLIRVKSISALKAVRSLSGCVSLTLTMYLMRVVNQTHTSSNGISARSLTPALLMRLSSPPGRILEAASAAAVTLSWSVTSRSRRTRRSAGYWAASSWRPGDFLVFRAVAMTLFEGFLSYYYPC